MHMLSFIHRLFDFQKIQFFSACYCLVSKHSDNYYLAWQAYVCYLN